MQFYSPLFLLQVSVNVATSSITYPHIREGKKEPILRLANRKKYVKPPCLPKLCMPHILPAGI